MRNKEYDIFVNHTLYPSADSIFNTSILPLDKVKDKCIYVLDTNALLVPYLTGSQSLIEIKKVFEKLKKQKRIIVPGQVAREFANNRPEKLKDTFQQLSRKQNGIQNFGIGKYPLLEEIDDYKKAINLEKEINEKLIQYRKHINSLVEKVKSWTWDDPVSLIYRQIFTTDTILDPTLEKEKIKEELDYRYLHKIPPGFKDEGKPDEGIGDLLIWLSILEIAKTKKDVVFISGDEKTDWYHRSEKQGLYPRFELVSEFKRFSDNKSFHIIRLSELLNLLGADDKVVKEVAFEERTVMSSHNDYMEFVRRAERAVFDWLLLRDDLGVRPNEHGFPDFEVNYDDGKKIGVEVFPLQSNQRLMMNAIRIKEKLYRAYYEIKENNFDKMHYVFVAKESGFNYNELTRVLERHKVGFDSNSFEFVFGYLNEQDEFIRVN